MGAEEAAAGASSAWVYIAECADGTLYTGWTLDVERRIREHNSPDKGAKYTRGRGPCRLVYAEELPDKRSAMRREWEIKNRMTRAQKEALISNYNIDKNRLCAYTCSHAGQTK